MRTLAGGLSCGMYTTNSASTTKYICEQAPLDLMVVQNYNMLREMLKDEPAMNHIVKFFVLMDNNESGAAKKENVLTWKEMIDNGQQLKSEILNQREEQQAVNQACMLIYTSGTTGPPKGKYFICHVIKSNLLKRQL